MQTLSADQLAAFLLEAKHSGVFEMYYIELATGLRRGELLGLKWEDIDFANQTLRVRRQVGRINGEVREAPLKTKNAYESIKYRQVMKPDCPNKDNQAFLLMQRANIRANY